MKTSINIGTNNTDDMKTKKTIMPTILIILFFIVYFLNTFNVYSIRIGQLILLILGLGGYIYTLVTVNRAENLYILIFFILHSVFGLVSYAMVGNANIVEYLWPIAFSGIAIIMLNFKLYYKPVFILYYLVCFFYMIAIIQNKAVESFTGAVSRNNISVTMLMFFSLFCIVSYIENKKIHPISVLLSLGISMWALGRSGIMTFGIILVGFILFEFKGKDVKVSKLVKVFSIIGIMYGMVILYYNTLIAPAINNFQAHGMASPRKLIWTTYLRKATSSAIYLIFGAPLNEDRILIAMDYNLHNSILHLHSRYGAHITLLFITILLIKLISFMQRRNILYTLLLIAIIFRINFDLSAFNGGLDVFIYYFMFEGLFNKTFEKENLRLANYS